jgi:hypothetical protein
VRRHANDGAYVCVAGTDPLNLVGTLLSGDKVPAVAGNRVLYRDGVAVAALVAGEFIYLTNSGNGTVESHTTAHKTADKLSNKSVDKTADKALEHEAREEMRLRLAHRY